MNYQPAVTGGSILRDANANLAGKWNIADEGANVWPTIECMSNGWIMSKNRLAVYDFYGAHRAGYTDNFHYLKTLSGNTLGAYQTTFLLRDDAQARQIHAQQHGHPNEIAPPCSNVKLRQNVEAFGSHGEFEATMGPDGSSADPMAWETGKRPALGFQHYLVMPGDTLESIAEKYNMGPDGARTLAFVNCLIPGAPVKTHWRLTIPPYYNHTNKADTFTNEDAVAAAIRGASLPQFGALTPIKPKHKKHSWWKTVLAVVVAVIAAYYLGPIANGLLSTALGADAAASATALQIGLAYGAAGGLTDMMMQCVGIALGMQTGFSLKELGASMITAGIGGGMAAKFPTLSSTPLLQRLLKNGVAVLTAQLAEVSLNLRHDIDPRAIAAQMLGATMGEDISAQLGDSVADQATAAALSTASSAVLGSAITHTPLDAENLAETMLGTAMGTSIGAKFAPKPGEDLLGNKHTTKHVPSLTKQAHTQQKQQRTATAAEKKHDDLHQPHKPKGPKHKLYDPSNDPEILQAEAVANMSLPSAGLDENTLHNEWEKYKATRAERWNHTSARAKDWSWNKFEKATSLSHVLHDEGAKLINYFSDRVENGVKELNEAALVFGSTGQLGKTLGLVASLTQAVNTVTQSTLIMGNDLLLGNSVEQWNATKDLSLGVALGVAGGLASELALKPVLNAAPQLFRNVSSLWNKVPEKEFELNRFHQAARNLSEEGQRNIRILRNWAKSKGWVKAPNPHGGPEVWGNYNKKTKAFEWNLKIKPESSERSASSFPRFDSRLDQILISGQIRNLYINPFIPEVGIDRSIGTHIHLETLEPMLKNEINQTYQP